METLIFNVGVLTLVAHDPFECGFAHTICTVFKGEFKLGNGQYCYPLTVTDQASRHVLGIEAFDNNKQDPVLEAFVHLFKERGLPNAMRSDNGVPFASPNGLYGLSKLSVWWLRLGINIERIKPGHPQQNGRHERMHLTLKKECAKPAKMNALQQQARFDEFNHERPHEALDMKTPAEVYQTSTRPYNGLPEWTIRSMTRTISSPHAGASACTEKRSTYQPYSQDSASN